MRYLHRIYDSGHHQIVCIHETHDWDDLVLGCLIVGVLLHNNTELSILWFKKIYNLKKRLSYRVYIKVELEVEIRRP